MGDIMDKSFIKNVKKEYNNKSSCISGDYPRVFVSTFCKKEFSSLGSVFSHMRDEHEFVHKSEGGV